VTLKTAVMMLKIELCITVIIHYILKRIKIERKMIFKIVIIFHNITVFTVLLIK